MVNFILAMGLPASGKSTYGKKLEYEKYRRIKPLVIVSSDAIREEFYNDISDQAHNEEVFNTMYKRTVAALKENKDVYYDATNLSAKKRISLVKNLKREKDINDKIRFCCCCFIPPFETCYERNNERTNPVPLYILDSMLKRFTPPHPAEGWDSIELIGKDNSINLYDRYVESFSIANDNHHHHNPTIGDHMKAALEYYNHTIKNNEVEEAVLFHDIGKPICKVYHDMKGNITKEAHYYNHANVGAYLYLSERPFTGDMSTLKILETANLIMHHMDYYQNEKYFERIKKLYGSEFIRKLDLVHEADEAAH